MSLSGLYPSAKGKHKSAQQNHAACSAEPSSLPGNDFVELVWENGQVVMQGQPSRARKNINNNNGLEDLPQISRLRDKALSKGDNSELGRLGMMDSTLNNFHIPVPSELDEHDDIVPWLSHHMDEPVHHNYSSNFITELSGVTATDLLNHTTNINPAERRSHGVRANKNSHPTSQQNPVGCEQLNLLPTRPKMSQLDQLSLLQSQCSFPSFRLKVSDTSSTCLNNTTENLLFADSAQKRFLPNVYPSMKMQTQDHGQRLSSSSIMNFSHFSKHAAVVKSSFDPISAKAGPDKSIPKQTDGKDKWSVLTGVKPSDPSQVAPASGQQSDIGIHSQPPVLSAVDESKLSKPQAMLLSANHSGHVGCQDSGNIDVYPKQALVPKGNMAVENVEKTAEPVAASSVCSGSSVDRASNDPTYGLKRKYHESEDLEYPSDDVEEESVGMKKTANNRVGSGSKRSRAAEVHNLSERRRRDRINEKMRALQELIPSCNKVDKASMLDEAIEYLKTLQLQVQMMSLGSGLCMPPMMLPHAAHMPRFSPMSAGMGMGMGYGLGMFDMIGNPSSCHLVQMPSVPGTPFQMAPAPMFGFQGQGVSMPMSCAPVSSYPVGLPSRPAMDLNTSSSPLPFGNLGSGQTSQKDTTQAKSNDVPLLKDDKSSPNFQDD